MDERGSINRVRTLGIPGKVDPFKIKNEKEESRQRETKK